MLPGEYPEAVPPRTPTPGPEVVASGEPLPSPDASAVEKSGDDDAETLATEPLKFFTPDGNENPAFEFFPRSDSEAVGGTSGGAIEFIADEKDCEGF